MKYLMILLLLTSCAAYVTPSDGHIHKSVLGIETSDQTPAPKVGGEAAPWELATFPQLSQDAQLKIIEGWNAWHGGAPPPSTPWLSILMTLVAGASGSNLLSSLLGAALGATNKGAANAAVAFSPQVQASWPQAILAGVSMLSPIHGVGPAASTALLKS